MNLSTLLPSPDRVSRVRAAAKYRRSVLSFRRIRVVQTWAALLETDLEDTGAIVIDPFVRRGDRPGLPEAGIRELVSEAAAAAVIAYADFSDVPPKTLWKLKDWGFAAVVGVGIDDSPRRFWETIFRAIQEKPIIGLLQELHSQSNHAVAYAIVRRSLELRMRNTTVADLCAELGVSNRHCRRILREADLPSPSRLLSWGRVLSAVIRLSGSGGTVEEVSRELRFSSPGNMRRMLQKKLGHSPTELRDPGLVRRAVMKFREVINLTSPRSLPKDRRANTLADLGG